MYIVVGVLSLVAIGSLIFSFLLWREVEKFRARIAHIEKPKDIYDARYYPPVVDNPSPEFPPELDTVGAWAQECAAAGVRVSDEEIKLQRRMRLEAGL